MRAGRRPRTQAEEVRHRDGGGERMRRGQGGIAPEMHMIDEESSLWLWFMADQIMWNKGKLLTCDNNVALSVHGDTNCTGVSFVIDKLKLWLCHLFSPKFGPFH